MASNPPTAELEQIKMALQRSPILKALMEVAPDAMQTALREEQHKAGTTLFREGEPGDRVYAIWTGRLRVQHERGLEHPVVLRDCFPGDVVGEIGLLDSQPRSATVLVVEDSRLVSLSRNDFKQIVGQRPDLMVDLLRVLSHRLRSSSDYIVATSRTVDQLSAQLARTNQPSQQNIAASQMWRGMYGLFQDLSESAESTQNGVNTLRGYLALINLPAKERRELDDLIGLVASHSHHTVHTLQESQALMRLQSGEFSLNRSAVMIGELCNTIASKLNPTARLKNVHFNLEVAPDLPKIYADFDLLDLTIRRLTHMLVMQAPQSGAIDMIVDNRFEREVQITIRSREGISIPQEYHETIFTPFFTLPDMPASGHGLELAAVRAVLQAHGGDIALRNVSQSEGTQFILRIPTNWEQYDGVDALT